MSLPVENNPFKQEADDYLRKHHILELFEDLCTSICYKQPDNIEEFIVEQLKIKKSQGNLTGIFGEDEIKNVFNLMDLQNSGKISKEKCKEALASLASSEFQVSKLDEHLKSVPAKVDYAQFKELCDKILSIKG
mmetsp:Transcript_62963/g.73281  ORF Transcript_62963/g.73281 Transcript_62963/m.73281 type:complete len:134 (+) Transcript_62963:26-427(+)|eukprot:CAMPEP_0176448298 /NCGR_PEP_ID=MMETSP0127-20121128/25679_1 /TAXON_ID=938130 /ORGANISM="Platyophrya macrostoma, Strain WH" /LENGTH=133 /DNA_ID=CAMNT_0017835179 /DNA_START=25 /DNA_END=426 /DNA_ORIENTATION=+